MRVTTRKVIAEFGPPAPVTHYEVEYKYPKAKRWQRLVDLHGIEWGLSHIFEYTSKEDAMRKARELSEGVEQYTTRVVEVVS